jgi:hypothetical protein
MHQCRRLQSLAGWFSGKLASRQSPKFLVDEWQQLLGRLGLSLPNLMQYAGHIGHWDD